MDESWMMPWMIIQSDHVAVQRFSWTMPWMSIQDDHVPVHAFHGRVTVDAMDDY